MKELWKIMNTTRFITTGYFFKIPDSYVFKSNNRKLFNDHISKIDGKDLQSKLWLEHLTNVNAYCDSQTVDLLDDELIGLKKAYNENTDSTVHQVIIDEENTFNQNADKFTEGTDNYDLRKYRPAPCFLPDGGIKFQNRQ